MNPFDLYKVAAKSVPAIKYALGIAGIVSLIVIIASFKIDYRVVLIGTLTMFVLMVILVLFANLASMAKQANSQNASLFLQPIRVMVWAFLLITIASAFLLFTSAFFCAPFDFGYKCNPIFGTKRQLPVSDSTATPKPDSTKEKPEPINPIIKSFRVAGPFPITLQKLVKEKELGFMQSAESKNEIQITFSGVLRKSNKEGNFWYPGGKIVVKLNGQNCFELARPGLAPTHKLGASKDEVTLKIEDEIRDIIEKDNSIKTELADEIIKCLKSSIFYSF